jgi:hypothetical protein
MMRGKKEVKMEGYRVKFTHQGKFKGKILIRNNGVSSEEIPFPDDETGGCEGFLTLGNAVILREKTRSGSGNSFTDPEALNYRSVSGTLGVVELLQIQFPLLTVRGYRTVLVSIVTSKFYICLPFLLVLAVSVMSLTRIPLVTYVPVQLI